MKALSNDKISLECKVCQLVKLFKNGSPFKMSKRAGDFISVNDLLNEVNKDSIRFMMLNRSNDVELDFDFDKVLEKSKENPVFYVQYCHARIQSIFRTTNYKNNKKFEINSIEINFNKFEKEILKKIFEWPRVVKISSRKYEPHRIPFYLYELATLFHSYWAKEMKVKNLNYKNDTVDKNVMIIIQLILIVLQNGMNILNVSLPEKCNVNNIIKFLTLIFVLLFLFVVFNYYFSEENINLVQKNRDNLETKMKNKNLDLPTLFNDTNDVIEFNSSFENSNKQNFKRSFWELFRN